MKSETQNLMWKDRASPVIFGKAALLEEPKFTKPTPGILVMRYDHDDEDDVYLSGKWIYLLYVPFN